MIIYSKNNIHALVEFENEKAGKRIFDEFDGKNWKNQFVIRVQYTSKNELVIKSNTLYEFDDSLSSTGNTQNDKTNEKHSTYSSLPTSSDATSYSDYVKPKRIVQNYANPYMPVTFFFYLPFRTKPFY